MNISVKDTLREALAAMISLVLVGSAVYFWFVLFDYAHSDKIDVPAFQRMRDVLQVVLPFAGTAVGYYLGRIPAERAADQAQRQANEKVELAAKTKGIAGETLERAEATLVEAERTTQNTGSGSIQKALQEISDGYRALRKL